MATPWFRVNIIYTRNELDNDDGVVGREGKSFWLFRIKKSSTLINFFSVSKKFLQVFSVKKLGNLHIISSFLGLSMKIIITLFLPFKLNFNPRPPDQRVEQQHCTERVYLVGFSSPPKSTQHTFSITAKRDWLEPSQHSIKEGEFFFVWK